MRGPVWFPDWCRVPTLRVATGGARRPSRHRAGLSRSGGRQAQTASELRISGTVEKLDGNLVALSLSQGSDLKAGSQVSIQAKSGQSGDLIATQIVL
jgi:hypothetical protein